MIMLAVIGYSKGMYVIDPVYIDPDKLINHENTMNEKNARTPTQLFSYDYQVLKPSRSRKYSE